MLALSAGATAPFTNGTGYIDKHLAGFRQHVNNARADKCLDRYPIRIAAGELAGLTLDRRRAVRVTWKVRHWRAHGAASSCAPPIHHLGLWLCVHANEGAWTDPNDPYFGGLQMGRWFMSTYGGRLYATKGTADHWTPAEQMAVADRAYHGEGHSSAWLNGQWPGTRDECGA